MIRKNNQLVRRRMAGFSIIEVLIVLAIATILAAISIPIMVSQRRLMRFSGSMREIATQLRYARQLAMSERQAITFQYDNSTKTITIIDHNNDTSSATSGTAVLANTSYPNTASPATIVSTVPLVQGGIGSTEIAYGVPGSSLLPNGHATLPTTLADGTGMTTLPSSSKINITFQADGSVVNPSGMPTSGLTLSGSTRMDSAIFLYDNLAPTGTPTAISILGSSGRVKIWRYIDSANLFAE